MNLTSESYRDAQGLYSLRCHWQSGPYRKLEKDVLFLTSPKGGSVIKSILGHPELSKTYKLRGVTRDVSKPAAVALNEKGVEMVSADLNDKVAVSNAIKGSSVVFGVTNCTSSNAASFDRRNVDESLQSGRNKIRR